MSIPNILSLLRLFITMFFILAILYRRFHMALFLFVIQALSDLFDGFLARLSGKKTDLGAYLDPLADKVMLISSYTILYLYDLVPFWVASAIVLRDLFIGSGFLLLSFFSFPMKPSPTMLGKLATIMQMCTVIYLLYSNTKAYLNLFFSLTVLFTLISGIEYTWKGIGIILKGKTSLKTL